MIRTEPTRAVHLTGHGLARAVGGGQSILSGVSLSIEPGELVGVAGGSGAGKTTLLETLAGIAPPDAGRVLLDGADLYKAPETFRSIIGYVPQDDIIHLELPLERTLYHAARLRMPPGTSTSAVHRAVDDSLSALDLDVRRAVPVGSLSGGQRKRASIAVEMLTDPRVFFLDEPTSGLDPATSADLLNLLRRLADSRTTIVLTTHAVQDLEACDRVAFLGPGGRLAFFGSVGDALVHFGVDRTEAIYDRLGTSKGGATSVDPISVGQPTSNDAGPAAAVETAVLPGAMSQFLTLAARTVETLVRNRLTLAILLGSPAMVVAMFVVLFRPGAFEFADPQPSAIVMILFWVAFGAFFFGLTYGLLQIVGERPILRRERLAGLGLGPYLASKVVVMLPFLALVNVVMLGVLRALDRLPAAEASTYASVWVTLTLTALAALALGLLTSAGVKDAAQATLALPMLCFPAVLFSGAILPVHIMAGVGRWIAAVVPSRWAFEAIGHDLGIRELMAEGGSPLGPPLIETYGDAGLLATTTYWAILVTFALVFLVASWVVLGRTAERASR